jgi:hypothetical protein
MCSAAASPIRARTTTPRRRSPSRRRCSTDASSCSAARSRPTPMREWRTRHLHRAAGTRLPVRAVRRAARRPRGDLPAQPGHRQVRRRHGRGRHGADRGLPRLLRRSAVAVRARCQAQVRLLPRHRRQPAIWPPARTVAKEAGVRYDFLLNVFDRSIIEVENRVYDASIKRHLFRRARTHFVALPDTLPRRAQIEAPIKGVLDTELEETYVVGTGYGRARCRSRRSTSAPRSCATASART